jgi:hypothetical protein
MSAKLLATIDRTEFWQDDENAAIPLRIWTSKTDLSVDVDGARESYRLDNRRPPALDDIHKSAGYPNGSWKNVLVPNPNDPSKPYVDEDGFCVSMTSYQREEFPRLDRRRYVDAMSVPYSVIPGRIRQICRGILLGCAARITDSRNGNMIDTVVADFSGGNAGECSNAAARKFGPQWSASNGDDRRIYVYEYFPNVVAVIGGETFKLKPMT